MYRFIPTLVALLFIGACSSQIRTPEGAFTANDYDFQPGETIHLKYNAADSSARFSSGDTMYLTISVYGDMQSRWYRQVMQQDGATFTASYKIPETASTVAFYASPKEPFEDGYSIRGNVGSAMAGARRSSFSRIAMAPGMWIARKEYHEESERNPESTERYAALWVAENRGTRKPTDYYSVVDSLYLHCVTPMLAPNARYEQNRFDAALVCLCADLQRGNFERALEIAQACKRVHPHGLTPGAFQPMVNEMWSAIAQSAELVKSRSDGDQRTAVIAAVVGMVIETESPQMFYPLMELGSPNFIVDVSAFSDVHREVRKRENIEAIAKLVAKREPNDLLNQIWMLREIQLGLIGASDSRTALKFSQNVLPAVERSLDWLPGNPAQPVAIDPKPDVVAAFHTTLDSLQNLDARNGVASTRNTSGRL